jgi:hypothetical protein
MSCVFMLNKDKNLLNYACGLRKIKKNKLDIELDLILQLLNAGAGSASGTDGWVPPAPENFD